MLLGYIFPPRCAVCRKILPVGTKREICPDCDRELPRIDGPRCEVCGAPMGEFSMPWCNQCAAGRPFVKCFVPFRYDGGVRRAITGMKYYDRPGRSRFFAGEIAKELGDFRPDFVTYVPQNSRTDRERGYNQTRLMAAELGRLLNVPVKSTLVHSPTGPHQVGLSRSKRQVNARRLYRPGKKRLGGTALIVDDVTTTGATLDACCRLLRKMGCEAVYAAAAAKATGIVNK